MNVTEKITEYQSALEENISLSQEETIIKFKRIAAQKRLSLAKDELRELELDTLSAINTKTV